MKRSTNKTPLALSKNYQIHLNKSLYGLILVSILLLLSTTMYAASPVKPLSNKVLKKIEERYDKETRKIFTGKGSEKNVLALKRLVAEEVEPTVAIEAIKKFNKAKKYRSGSAQKRKALSEVEALFEGTKISKKKGRDIMIGAGSSISARKSKTVQKTYQKANRPSCSNKISVTKRAPKVKYQDPDQLAKTILLTSL